MRYYLCLFALCSLGCGSSDTATPDAAVPIDAASSSDAGSVSSDAGSVETDGEVRIDSGSNLDGGSSTGGWVERTHPCPGINRTDALHVDEDGTLWVGCGTGAVGRGLFRSVDRGIGWNQPATELETMRINSISRGSDGALYVAGTEGPMVARVDTSSTPMTVSPVLTSVTSVGRQFVVGAFRMRADGSAIAESLNGTDMLYRPAGSSAVSAADWINAASAMSPAEQFLDLIVEGDRFIGVGSRISEPPMLFLPSRSSGTEPYHFEKLVLSTAFDGELWGVAGNETRIVAVGVDQDADGGKIFVSGADIYDVSGYTEIDVGPLVSGSRTWARGVCMRGERVVVVGEIQPLRSDTGFVLLSDDGGASFTDITPPGVGDSVSKCVIQSDGSVVAAGARGWVGFYGP